LPDSADELRELREKRTDELAQVTEWLPAAVPGNVHADLLALGRIGDPFCGLNNEDSQWVDERDWWCRKALSLQLDEGERAFLVFEGVDYISLSPARRFKLPRLLCASP